MLFLNRSTEKVKATQQTSPLVTVDENAFVFYINATVSSELAGRSLFQNDTEVRQIVIDGSGNAKQQEKSIIPDTHLTSIVAFAPLCVDLHTREFKNKVTKL